MLGCDVEIALLTVDIEPDDEGLFFLHGREQVGLSGKQTRNVPVCKRNVHFRKKLPCAVVVV